MRVLRILPVIFLSVLIAVTSQAETDYVCAAVFPCDAEGNLLEQYSDSGQCFEYYVNQCLIYKLQITRASLQACQFENIGLQGEIDYNEVMKQNAELKESRKRLRNKLRRLRKQ